MSLLYSTLLYLVLVTVSGRVHFGIGVFAYLITGMSINASQSRQPKPPANATVRQFLQHWCWLWSYSRILHSAFQNLLSRPSGSGIAFDLVLRLSRRPFHHTQAKAPRLDHRNLKLIPSASQCRHLILGTARLQDEANATLTAAERLRCVHVQQQQPGRLQPL